VSLFCKVVELGFGPLHGFRRTAKMSLDSSINDYSKSWVSISNFLSEIATTLYMYVTNEEIGY